MGHRVEFLWMTWDGQDSLGFLQWDGTTITPVPSDKKRALETLQAALRTNVRDEQGNRIAAGTEHERRMRNLCRTFDGGVPPGNSGGALGGVGPG